MGNNDNGQHDIELWQKLDEINRLIHSSLEFDTVMQQALNATGKALGAVAGAVFLAKTKESATAFYQFGFPQGFIGTNYAEDAFPFAKILADTQEPVAIEEEQMDRLMNAEVAARFRIRSVMAIPLLRPGELIGGIGLAFDQPHRFARNEIDFARRIGASVSLAIENARLLNIERQSARLGEELARIDRTIHSSLYIDEIIHRVTLMVEQALHIDSCRILLLKDGNWSVPAGFRITSGLSKESFSSDEVPYFLDVLREQKTIMVPDVVNEPEMKKLIAPGYKIRSSMMAPISGQQQKGVLVCNTFDQPREYSRQEINFIEQMATTLGLAIRNAQLFEAEQAAQKKANQELEITNLFLEAANKLSQSLDVHEVINTLLAIVEKIIPGASASISFIDEKAGQLKVMASTVDDLRAGETFDLTQLRPGHLEVLTKKKSIIVNYGRADRSTDDYSGKEPGIKKIFYVPLRIGSRVIGDLAVDISDEMYVLDDREMQLLEGVAAQAAIIIKNARLFESESHIAEILQEALLTAPKKLPGIDFDYIYRSATVQMEPSDILVLYTDGVTEARRGVELFGEKRLMDIIKWPRKPKEMTEAIYLEVSNFAGGQLSDDLAVLAIGLKD